MTAAASLPVGAWPLWTAPDSLVLASKSATRLAMLAAAGIPADPMPARVDERAIEADAVAGGATPPLVAAVLARAKALDVSNRLTGRLVLGADQTLSLGDRALHKPTSRAQAAEQLRDMAGRTHVLVSAATLALDGAAIFDCRSEARLAVRALSNRAIEAYLDAAGDAVYASVGGYQAEGVGVQLFEALDGDHFTILGLPLLDLLAELRRMNRLIA